MTDAVIAAIARSPIGRAGKGSLREMRPDDLAAQVVAATLEQVPQLDSSRIEDLYLGAWEHSGPQAENIARRVAVQLGFDSIPGATVNRACASSVETIRMAVNAIRAGDGEAYLAGGVEMRLAVSELACGGFRRSAVPQPVVRGSRAEIG